MDVKKERLISTCNFFGTSWFNDLNNFNLHFERPRIRDELSNYRKINLSTELKKKKILNDRNEKKICNFFFFPKVS